MGSREIDYTEIVPAATGHRLHMAGTFVDGAVDIYAPPWSMVLAPADGWVEEVAYLRLPLFGYQIRGYVVDEAARRHEKVGFVMAHLMKDTYPQPGLAFAEGEQIGEVTHWDAHPAFSHVHLAFRVGDGKMPPPGNIKVERMLRRLRI